MTEWIAVYEVAPYGEDRRSEFIKAAGGAIFEGAAACFDGLPDRLGVDGGVHVLGVVAPTRSKLDQAMGRVQGRPQLSAELPSNCLD